MYYVQVNGKRYDAKINGNVTDFAWDNRESKSITLEMTHAEAVEIFKDGVSWSIVETYTEDEYDIDMNKTVVDKEREWDNSDYSLSGDIVDHRDGTVTIKMGKLTDLESAYSMLIGG